MREALAWLTLRYLMAFIFLWAFVDKVFGLGFSTPTGKGWLAGNSPTAGFLQAAVRGPFAGFYHSLAGNPLVDWIFMLAILAIGLSLLTGIWKRAACWGGFVFMIVMWSALLPPTTNPIIDEHILYAVILLGLAKRS